MMNETESKVETKVAVLLCEGQCSEIHGRPTARWHYYHSTYTRDAEYHTSVVEVHLFACERCNFKRVWGTDDPFKVVEKRDLEAAA